MWSNRNQKLDQIRVFLTKMEDIIEANFVPGKEISFVLLELMNLVMKKNWEESKKLINEKTLKYSINYPFLYTQFQNILVTIYLRLENNTKAIRITKNLLQLYSNQKNYLEYINTGKILADLYSSVDNYIDEFRTYVDIIKILFEPDKEISFRHILHFEVNGFESIIKTLLRVVGFNYESIDVFRSLNETISEKLENHFDEYLDVFEEDEELEKKLHQINLYQDELEELLSIEENKLLINDLITNGSKNISVFDENTTMLPERAREILYNALEALEKVIGYRFNHPFLLWQALLDPENEELGKNTLSGKLAFLGDAALKLTLTDILLQQDIDTTLKTLSETRQGLEKNNYLAKIFDKINLEGYVLTTKKEMPTNEHWKGTVVESIIGAIYLDGSIQAVKRFVIGWNPKALMNKN